MGHNHGSKRSPFIKGVLMKPRLLGRIGCLGGVAAMCAAAGLATGAPVASAAECASITGSGSSLQNLAHKSVWEGEWEASGFSISQEGLSCTATAKVTYEPTSSGKGLGEWGSKGGVLVPSESFNKSKLDEFVGTDVGPEGTATTGQIGNMDEAGKDIAGGEPTKKNAVIAVPIAQSAISVIVSLPVGCTASGTEATVNNTKLAEEWNENKVSFSSLLTGVTLSGTSCSEAPALQAREAASGTTAGFKRYLADLDSAVYGTCTANAVESESTTCWPEVGNKHESGNETGGELATKVYDTPGSTGYADLADARAHGFADTVGTPEKHTFGGNEYQSIIVRVPNGGTVGHDESPEGTEGAANCEKAEYPEPATVGPNIDWSKAKQGNATSGSEGVYPICTLTFGVAWEHNNYLEWENPVSKAKEKYSQAQFTTMFNYLRWVVTSGQEGTAKTKLEKEHFLGVPAKVAKEDKEGFTMENVFFSKKGE